MPQIVRRSVSGVALLATLAACGGTESGASDAPTGPSGTGGTTTTAPPARDTARVVLQNLGLVLAPHDATTRRAGDVDFARAGPRAFWEFGFRVTTPTGEWKGLPHYTWLSPPGTPIVSAIDGVVRWARDQGKGDYEILLAPNARSTWWVSYDHLVRPRVDSGDVVHVGDTLGFAPGTADVPMVWELMAGDYATDRAFCPHALLAPALRAGYADALARLVREWETFRGDTTLYDESRFVAPGCLVESMPGG